MNYLASATQMKQADQYTMEILGIPSLQLMENAARSCVDVMKQKEMDLSNVTVVCGSGNNGGDGFAVARILLEQGNHASVVFVGNPLHLTEETAWQMEHFKQAGGSVIDTFDKDNCSLLIDAIFGIGLSREITGSYSDIIDTMNQCQSTKLALDIPSGIDATTGAVLGTAFQADYTVTFQCGKLGMCVYPGRSYSGQVIVKDIGIDVSSITENPEAAICYDRTDLQRLMPKRKSDSHKGDYGRALIIAGSKGMAGAAYLGAYAAYMSGAGLVRIYTTEDNRSILQTLLPEAIITTYDLYDERELIRLLKWADVVSIGSGIGTSDKSRKILAATLENVTVPCVVDADGLNLLADHKNYLSYLQRHQFIFTPHMKEMTRILKVDMEDLKKNRRELLTQFVTAYPVTCVLKDACTLVSSAGKEMYFNLSGNAAMAKAGSGDVLAGVITGLLAQGADCYTAATAGVYLHGLAGDAAKEEQGEYSVLARDIARHIGTVLKNNQEE